MAMKRSHRKAFSFIITIVCLAIIGLVIAVAADWKKVGLTYKHIPDVVWQITHPVKVANECIEANGGRLCCDKSDSPFNCMTTLEYRASDYCNKYHQTCRVQADGHCGWDADDLSREKQCIDNDEYPPLNF